MTGGDVWEVGEKQMPDGEMKAEAKAAKRFAPEAPGGGWCCGRLHLWLMPRH